MTDISQVSSQWQFLFNLYAILGSIVGAIVIGWLTYNLVKYRARRGAIDPEDGPKADAIPAERGSIRSVVIITVVIAAILFPLSIGTFQTVDLIQKPPSADNFIIEVEGFQWGWKFIYPNGYEAFGDLRIPKDRNVIFLVTSNDVFHNFGLLEFKIKADAIPGRTNQIWINAEQTGTYRVACFEFCGAGHTVMTSELIVMDAAEFEQWYANLPR